MGGSVGAAITGGSVGGMFDEVGGGGVVVVGSVDGVAGESGGVVTECVVPSGAGPEGGSEDESPGALCIDVGTPASAVGTCGAGLDTVGSTTSDDALVVSGARKPSAKAGAAVSPKIRPTVATAHATVSRTRFVERRRSPKEDARS
ncbi:hypothetical protein [Luethyella okanaganae]|uniref:Uncharacterized protein n=1 Tax=Luethyella okanaganae TaxID=69372 RepID=A0ABW1VHN5_9MICO